MRPEDEMGGISASELRQVWRAIKITELIVSGKPFWVRDDEIPSVPITHFYIDPASQRQLGHVSGRHRLGEWRGVAIAGDEAKQFDDFAAAKRWVEEMATKSPFDGK